MIGAIITGVLTLLTGGLERYQKRQELKADTEAKIQLARAEAEVVRLQKAQDAEVAWDNIAAGQMETSWKDEWFTLLLSVPAIMAFIPGGPEIVAQGFTALGTMPEWYIYAFLTAIAASFGVRSLLKFVRR